MQLNSPAAPGHTVTKAANGEASKCLQITPALSGSGMLIFILFGLISAQTSGLGPMGFYQSRKARLKEIAVYVYKECKQTNQAFL